VYYAIQLDLMLSSDMEAKLNRVTCIIIEDAETDRELFQNKINRYFKDKLQIVGIAESVNEGVELIRKESPEIVFLDIEMPGENGFKLFDYITDFAFEVIFTTGYEKYAIDALKYAALDYIIKPVTQNNLSDALSRFYKKRDTNSSQKRIETYISNLSNGTDINQKVAFPTMDGYHMERINDILYCEGDVNYTRVHLNDGKLIMVSRTLKEVELLLGTKHFFRVHKSFLVNLNYVKSYSRSENGITLDNKKKLPVSIRKNDEFLAILTKRTNKPNKDALNN
jgi:two-component system, LytTR family, response regulator